MYRHFRYRIYPTSEQQDALNFQLREACDLYNCALEERLIFWKECAQLIGYYDQANQIKEMRAEGLIGVANYSCCQDVLRRLDKTFKDFYRRIKSGNKPGFPRFKSSNRYDCLVFPSYGDGCKLKDRLVYIQGVGKIKVKLHRPVEGKVKTVSVKRESGKWFAVFVSVCEDNFLPASTESIGVDLGLTSFLTLSDGSSIDNPRFDKEAQRKLRVAQRRLSRRASKKSNRRRKAALMLQQQYAHVRHQRSDFHHKVSRMLVNSYGLIAVEKLAIRGLANSHLATSVRDAGWGMFLIKLAFKAENAGRELIKVNPRGTSQTCLCGENVPKKLWDRWHSCSSCGLEGDRDHVSAQVILQRGLRCRDVTWPDVRASVLREAVAI